MDRRGDNSIDDSAASPPASVNPTGVAKSNPPLRPASSTPGVAAACRPRNTAAVKNASATRKSRASDRRRAASLMTTASATLTAATVRTSQK